MQMNTTQEILDALRAGRMVIIMDDEDRENEGDLLMVAGKVRPEDINFMARYGRGLICLTLTRERCAQLRLPLMVSDTDREQRTNFTLSIEAAEGITTGISAYDRAHTVQTAVRDTARPEDLRQPGHVFPVMAQPGGVLTRAGHTEAGCDLAALAGCSPAAVICEILKDDGAMARLPDLVEFARAHGLRIGTIADLIHYRNRTERLVERVAERPVMTPHGAFRLVVYREKLTDATHIALVRGPIGPESEVLVRVHEPLSVMDFIDTHSTSHSWNFAAALAAIADAGRGIVVLLHRPESAQELRVRAITDQPPVSSRMDLRNYGIGAQILRDLNVRKMKLMAKPRKMPSMTGFDLEVTGFIEPPAVRKAS